MANSHGITALVLAAGNSQRMGTGNKLLMQYAGEASVRRAVRAAQVAGIDDVVVVIAAGSSEVTEALHGLRVRIVENHDHAEGIASSIRAGIAAVTPVHAGALLMLADMPLVAPQHIAPLLAAFAAAKHDAIIVPHFRGHRGNPVLWGRGHFGALMALTGDVGARGLLGHHVDCVIRVEAPDDAILVDFDTPQDWARLRAQAS